MADEYTKWGVVGAGEAGCRIAVQYIATHRNRAIGDRVLLLNSAQADLTNLIRHLQQDLGDAEGSGWLKIATANQVLVGNTAGAGNWFMNGERTLNSDWAQALPSIRRVLAGKAANVVVHICGLGGGTGNGSVPLLIHRTRAERVLPDVPEDYIFQFAMGVWPDPNDGPHRQINALMGLSRMLRFTPPEIRNVVLDPDVPVPGEEVILRIETSPTIEEIDLTVRKNEHPIESRAAARRSPGLFETTIVPREGNYALDLVLKGDKADPNSMRDVRNAVTFTTKAGEKRKPIVLDGRSNADFVLLLGNKELKSLAQKHGIGAGHRLRDLNEVAVRVLDAMISAGQEAVAVIDAKDYAINRQRYKFQHFTAGVAWNLPSIVMVEEALDIASENLLLGSDPKAPLDIKSALSAYLILQVPPDEIHEPHFALQEIQGVFRKWCEDRKIRFEQTMETVVPDRMLSGNYHLILFLGGFDLRPLVAPYLDRVTRHIEVLAADDEDTGQSRSLQILWDRLLRYVERSDETRRKFQG